MANTDIISRLRLDSGEFDSKIKRAGQELLEYSEHCKNMGLEMGYANKDAKDFAAALGDMKTVSQTARGKLSELTEAFTNLKAMYNQMTDAEKQNTFGKELAASLEKLKARINEAKENLNSVNAELGNTKQAEDKTTSGIEAMTSALGINVKSLAGWGAALAAGKAALDVAKDAFFANESTVDEWGRTVESAKGIYEGFLQALNTGDISGFLSNIGQITAAAREAYNALDELGTRQTILNPERARLQARSTELKATIRREGADSAAGKAAAAELKALEKPLTEAWKTESKLNRNAFEALVKQRLKEGGVNLNQKSFNEFMKTFSDDAAFQRLRRGAKGSIGVDYTSGGSYDEGSVQKVDTRNTNQKLLDLFTDEWRKENSAYLSAAFNAEGSAASVMLSDARYLKGGGGGGKGKKAVVIAGPDFDKIFPTMSSTGGSMSRGDMMMQSIQANMAYANMEADQEAMKNILTLAMKEGLNTSDIDANDLLERIFNGEDIPTDFWDGLMERMNEALSEMGKEGYDLDENGKLKQRKTPEEKQEKNQEKINKSLAEGLGQMASGLNGLQGSFAQLGIDLGEGFGSVVSGLSGISSILLAIQTIVGAIEAISAADTIIPFANGGIVPHAANGHFVPGYSFSGDNTPIMANAGELILNRAQQNSIASQLEDGGLQNLQLDTIISGEDIRVVLNNNGRRTGRGEYITSRNRRG
jgi:hypothetical protein